MKLTPFCLLCTWAWSQPAIELYPNIHTMGITADIAGVDDPDGDCVATVRVRVPPAAYRDALPLSRNSATRLVGSLFALQPATTYEVEIAFTDPDGDPIDGVIVVETQTTLAQWSPPTFTDELLVSPTGSGSACSLAMPCSLEQALSQVQPGEAILLRNGVYRGSWTLPRSGTEGQPIALKAFEGEAPILDGASDQDFTWTLEGNGVYSTTVPEPDTHLVTADGERLYPYQSYADLEDQIWGLGGFYSENTTVNVKLDGGSDPNPLAMVVAQSNTAFELNRDHWIIDGLTFRHYGLGSYAKAIYLNGGSNNVIQNCVFAINDAGIGLKRESHRNIIQDNRFYDTIFMWPWDAVKAGSQLETGGVVVYSPMSGRGNIIRRNVFHDYFDGFQCCPGDDNGLTTNEMDIHDNEIYNCGDDGLSADGVCANVRIWNNEFYDVLVGISLAPILEGPVYCLRNLIHRTGAGNSIYTGYPFKFNVGGQPTSGPMFLFHNTSDAVHPGNHGFDIKSPGSWSQLKTRNNIWVGTDYGLRNANTSQPLDMDFDLLWNDGLNHLVRWGSTHYTTLLDFQLGQGQNLEGIEADPLFVDSANANYRLQSLSSAIDQGQVIPGINDGFQGIAPDLGAFETTSLTIPFDAWYSHPGDPHYQPAFDLNGDQIIDIRDYCAGLVSLGLN